MTLSTLNAATGGAAPKPVDTLREAAGGLTDCDFVLRGMLARIRGAVPQRDEAKASTDPHTSLVGTASEVLRLARCLHESIAELEHYV